MFIAILTIISGLRRGLVRIDGWDLGGLYLGWMGWMALGRKEEGCFVRDPFCGR